MNKILNLLKIGLFLGVVLWSYNLRLFNYSRIPFPGQSMDEYSNSWVGLSLIKLGFPVGISGISGYKNNDMRYINVDRVFQETAKGNPLAINKPWFDHPPLMGLVTGGFASIKGAEVFEDTIAVIIRKPMVWMGTISVALVGIWVMMNFDFVTGILAMLVYGTMPLVVISSRMIQAENGLIPIILLSMITLSLYVKTNKWWWLWIAGLIAGVGTLFKLSGVTNLLMINLFLLIKNSKNKWLEITLFSVVSLSITSLFIFYGLIYDWNIFKNILFSNSSRFYGIGPSAFYNLLTQVRLTHDKYISDPWPLVGWISWMILIAKEKKNSGEIILILGIMSYLITYIFLGSQPYGWYAFPFWPLLSISFAVVMTQTLVKNQFALSGLLVLIPFGENITKLVTINNFQFYANKWRLILAIFLMVIIWQQTSKNKKMISILLKILIMLIFILAIYMNSKYLSFFDTDFWYKVK